MYRYTKIQMETHTQTHPHLEKKVKAITAQVPSVRTLIIHDKTQLPRAVVCICMFVCFMGRGGGGFKHQSLSKLLILLSPRRTSAPAPPLRGLEAHCSIRN